MPLSGPVFRITLVAVLATAVAAQTKPSAQRKSEVTAAKTASHPAQVTYTGGQLSVVANNNSLAETLAEIRSVTKARFEGVQPGVAERISGEFGPDTPRAVVGALLSSSHYNFILVSPPGNPAVLQRIVLSEPAPEPVAAVQPATQPSVQTVSPPQPATQTTPPTQPGQLEKPSADVPGAVGRQPSAAATDEPQSPEVSLPEQSKPEVKNESGPSKEAKLESDRAADPNDPNQANKESQPSIPATVVICGITYDASQLADLKVPDHCGKPAQQPSRTAGSR